MKKYLFISLMVCIILTGFAQTPRTGAIRIDTQYIDSPVTDPKSEPFTWVQEMPKFPGGDQGVFRYIQDHINYAAVSSQIKGRVTVRFVVDENGDVKHAEVPKGMGIGGGCDQEAIRVVSSLPKWQPGKQNGHAVPVWYTVPVRF